MNKIITFVGIVLFLFGVLVIGSYHFFGLGGAVGGFVLFLALTKLAVHIVKQRFVQIGKALFDSKSRVLRDAEVTVHQVSKAPRVENSEIENRDCPTKFYFVDVTIKPAVSDGSTPFSCWDSTELLLVPFDAPTPDINAAEASDYDGPQCHIHDVTYVEPSDKDSDENSDENDESQRTQRLKLHVEVPEQTNRLKFQYYFETFGDVIVP